MPIATLMGFFNGRTRGKGGASRTPPGSAPVRLRNHITNLHTSKLKMAHVSSVHLHNASIRVVAHIIVLKICHK